MPPACARLLIVAVIVLAAGAPLSAQSGSGPLSPRVLATYHLRTASSGLEQLELLVLWRGESRWYARPNSGGSVVGSAGSALSSNTYVWTARYGDTELDVSVDVKRRTATILGAPIDLRLSNVVFVDRHADGTGWRIVGTLRVEAGLLPSRDFDLAGRILPVLRAAPEIAAFLGCDSGPLEATGVTNVCALLAGR